MACLEKPLADIYSGEAFIEARTCITDQLICSMAAMLAVMPAIISRSTKEPFANLKFVVIVRKVVCHSTQQKVAVHGFFELAV